MTQPTEPQALPEQTTDATAQPNAQWTTIYETDTVTASVLLRDGYVTRLLVKTPTTLPFSFAQKVLRRWNTDSRRHFKIASEEWVQNCTNLGTSFSGYCGTEVTTASALDSPDASGSFLNLVIKV